MGTNTLAIDTCVLLHYLGGSKNIRSYITGNFLIASCIVRMESQVYHRDRSVDLEQVLRFLRLCEVVDIDPLIEHKTVQIRSEHGIKLPDALIVATAICREVPFVTTDKRFQRLIGHYDVRILEP